MNLFKKKMKKDNYFLAIFFILLSTIGFPSVQMLVKLLPDTSLSSKIFYRNIIIVIISFVIIKRKKISFKVEKSEISILLMRIFFGLLGVAINFYAISFIMLSDSTSIQKTSSFIMMLLSYIFFKEKFNKIQFISIIVAFIGVLFITKPGSSSFSVGHIYVIIAAISASLAYICIRALGIRKKLHPSLIVFYFSLASAIITFPFAINDMSIFNIRNALLLIGIGIFGAIGQFGITFAYNYAPSKEISVFEYTQVLFSSILGFIFLKEIPDMYSIIGYLIIVFIGIFIFYYNKRGEYVKKSFIKR